MTLASEGADLLPWNPVPIELSLDLIENPATDLNSIRSEEQPDMMNRAYSLRNFWFKISLALAAGVFASLAAAATDKMDVMVTVHQFVDSFNKGDVKTAITSCATQTSIIDEFAPYAWNGAGACAKWIDDYDVDAKKNGISGGIVKLGEPWHVDITADRAYVVIPANYTFKEKGKVVKESKSVITIALQKGDGGWRITGWTWSKH
jgi:hypothetical protein